MISFGLDADDLADTRFALSPLMDTVLSLRVLREPGLSTIHAPWRRATVERVGGALDTALLASLVARHRTTPDFLTPARSGSPRPSPRNWPSCAAPRPPSSAETCSTRTTRTRSPRPCSPRSPTTTEPSPPCATPSATCCTGTGRSRSSRPGPRCGSCSKPT
ncbi:hypothetical protein ACU4GG_32355 [Streptomyces nojiriensis]